MGKKVTALVVSLLYLSMSVLPVSAHTTDDLCEIYDIPIVDGTPEDAAQVVKDYDAIKRFIAMYNYVDLSVPDTSSQDALIEELKSEVKELDNQLLNGYYLSWSEILDLEDRRDKALRTISDIERTYDYVNVEVDIPSAEDAPTFQEYTEAKKVIAAYKASKEIGSLTNLNYPISGDCMIYKHTKVKTVFTCPSLSGVKSLFNGVVTYVDDECVEITTCDSVVVRYDSMYSVDVAEGTTVYQYMSIGTVYKQLDVILSINNKYCDVNTLFEEVS